MIERQIISALITHPDLYAQVEVKDSDFGNPRLGKIFRATLELLSDGETPDVVLITEKLGDEWLPEVIACTDEVAVPQSFGSYQRILKEAKHHRDLLSAGHIFVADVQAKDPGAVARLQESLKRAEQGSSEIVSAAETAVDVVQHLDDLVNNRVKPGLPTGISKLDEITGGLKGGKQYVIAARTNVGKSAMMCNIASNIKAPCLIISGEMDRGEVVQRLLAKIAKKSAFKLSSGIIKDSDWPDLIEAAKEIKDIMIVDIPRPTIDDVERLTRMAHVKHGIKAVFLDYLQLFTSTAYQEKRLQVADISARCKHLARELDIPVVVLAQLNRNADGRKPRLSDLKESGAIEEDADVVALMYVPEDVINKTLVIDVQKHRAGPKGFFQVGWNPEYMRVEDL